MMSINITEGLRLIGALTELAKRYKNREINNKITELQQFIMAFQSEILEIREENNKLKAKIEELQRDKGSDGLKPRIITFV